MRSCACMSTPKRSHTHQVHWHVCVSAGVLSESHARSLWVRDDTIGARTCGGSFKKFDQEEIGGHEKVFCHSEILGSRWSKERSDIPLKSLGKAFKI